MRRLESDANPRFRRWLKLAVQPRAVREEKRSLAEGLHLAEAVLQAGQTIEAVLVRKGAGVQVAAWAERAAASGSETFELAPRLFDRLSPVEAGVGLLLVIRVAAVPLPASLAQDTLYLDGIQEPGNAGALLRVAAAAGVARVLTAPGTTGMWSPKALRAGQGAHFALTIHEGVGADTAAGLLPHWLAADLGDAVPLWEAELPRGPLGWVLGAEGSGVSTAMRARCFLRVTIPLAAGVESLNVAAAAAVLLFERRRRLLTQIEPSQR